MLNNLCTGESRLSYEQMLSDWNKDIQDALSAEAAVEKDSLQGHSARSSVPTGIVIPVSSSTPSAPLGSSTPSAPLTPIDLVEPVVEFPGSIPPILPILPSSPKTIEPNANDPPMPLQDLATQTPSADNRITPSQPQRPRRTGVKGHTAGYYAKLNNASSTEITEIEGCHLTQKQCTEEAGEYLTDEAGIKEVINILSRQAVVPINGCSLSQIEQTQVLPSFMFYKIKDLTPEELAKQPTLDPAQTEGWQSVLSKKQKKKQSYKIKVKARWVGGGHKQRNVDKTVIASPTARTASHNVILNLTALERRILKVGDVPSAFLQTKYRSTNGKPLYVRMDKDTTRMALIAYPHLSKYVLDDGTMITKVQQALYGTVEAAMLWYEELIGTLSNAGFFVVDADQGVVYKGTHGHDLYASIHVDDLKSSASDNVSGKTLDKEFWGTLEAKYKGLAIQHGPHYRHLSCELHYDKKNGVITKSQTMFLRKLLKQHAVTGRENLPYRLDILKDKPTEVAKLTIVEHSSFRSALQQVAYLVQTRPTIAWIISYLQCHAHAPNQTDLSDLWHLLRYLNAHQHVPLVFNPTDAQLRACTDTSYALYGERSHLGFAITLGGTTNAPIAAKSSLIKLICRSSTEAEIHGVNELTSELLWTVDLLTQLGYPQQPVPILEDNQSCITMMQQQPRNFQSKSRHIRVKWSFFRQLYQQGIMFLTHCPTDHMTADLLTKPLGGMLFRRHAKTLQNFDAVEGCIKHQSEE